MKRRVFSGAEIPYEFSKHDAQYNMSCSSGE